MLEDIDPEVIVGWKAQYGQIYLIDNKYVFRALTIREHDEPKLHPDWSGPDCEDFFVKIAILYPTIEDLEKLPAGIVSSLAEELLDISGYGDPSFAKKSLELAREKANEVISLMKIFIISAMPAYTDDVLDNYTFSELIKKVALAEKILEVRQGVVLMSGYTTLELIDPQEEQEKEEKKLNREASLRKPGQATRVDPVAQKLHEALNSM